MRINWDEIEENQYELLPDGEYAVRIVSVVEKTAKTGTPYWNIEFTIESGDYAGRKVWDKLFFTPKTMNRVKFVAHRLGVDTTGETEFSPNDLTNRTCIITLLQEEYRDDHNVVKTQNIVPFDGYKVDEFTTKGVDKKDDDDSLPF